MVLVFNKKKELKKLQDGNAIGSVEDFNMASKKFSIFTDPGLKKAIDIDNKRRKDLK